MFTRGLRQGPPGVCATTVMTGRSSSGRDDESKLEVTEAVAEILDH